MRALGLAVLAACLLFSAAWAGDGGSCGGGCHAKQACDCDKCGHDRQCDGCAARGCADSQEPCDPSPSDDLCGVDMLSRSGRCCEPCDCSAPCEACAPGRVREGCLPVPLPEDGCWSIDPRCCPRQEYCLLCCERAEFRLLCPPCKPCKVKPCCKHRCKCKDDCGCAADGGCPAQAECSERGE